MELKIIPKEKYVNILGKQYMISIANYNFDSYFEKNNPAGAYCDLNKCNIIVCDLRTHPDWKDESELSCIIEMKHLLRHEIVHTFLYESGLHANSNNTDAWATNEEMVDWIAIQGIKIYKIWEEANAL